MKNDLKWFMGHIGKRIYKAEGLKSDPEARDGVFVSSINHAKLLAESGVKYSKDKKWY